MEIKNCTSALNAYQNTMTRQELTKPVQNVKRKNTDKVEFSKNAVDSFKSAVLRNAEATASPERISALKNALRDGQYNVPSESIAAAILEA